jgi:hypothetical protein
MEALDHSVRLATFRFVDEQPTSSPTTALCVGGVGSKRSTEFDMSLRGIGRVTVIAVAGLAVESNVRQAVHVQQGRVPTSGGLLKPAAAPSQERPPVVADDVFDVDNPRGVSCTASRTRASSSALSAARNLASASSRSTGSPSASAPASVF